MKAETLKPIYPYKPIYSVESLLKALSISRDKLNAVIENKSYYDNVIRKNGKTRKAYVPNSELKKIQAKIKKNFLEKVNYPKYLHGSLKKRSARTNAAYHNRANILITEDLKNFFDKCNKTLVYNVWHKFFNFSKEVATILTELTTHKDFLPQGASTSPYLANLVFFDLEHAVVKKITELDGVYTRYVDDICVSFTKAIPRRTKEKVIREIVLMVKSKGLCLNRKKHKIFNSRDKKLATGVVINNKKLSLGRERIDEVRRDVYILEKNTASTSAEEILRVQGKISHAKYIYGAKYPTKFKKLEEKLSGLR